MSRRTVVAATFFMLLAVPALAQSPLPGPRAPEGTETGERTTDSGLAKFRSAYTSGDGITCVAINDEKGERLYRYGDASRLTAKRNNRGYMLFTWHPPTSSSCRNPRIKPPL